MNDSGKNNNPELNLSRGAPGTNITRTEDCALYNYVKYFLIQNYPEAAKNKIQKEKKSNKAFSDEELGINNFGEVTIQKFIDKVVRLVHADPDRMDRPKYNHILAVHKQAELRGSKLLDQTVDILLSGNLENLSLEQVSRIIPTDNNSTLIKSYISVDKVINYAGLKEKLKPHLSEAVKTGKFQFTKEQEKKFYTFDDYETHQYLALMHDMVEDNHVTIEQLKKIAGENKNMLRAIELLPFLNKSEYVDNRGAFILQDEHIKQSIEFIANWYQDNPNKIEFCKGGKYDIAKLNYVEFVQYKAGYSDRIAEKMKESKFSEKDIFIALDIKEIDQNHNRSPSRNDLDAQNGKNVGSAIATHSDEAVKILELSTRARKKRYHTSVTNMAKYSCCVNKIREEKSKLEFCKIYKCTGLANTHFYSNSYNIPDVGVDKNRRGLKKYGEGDPNFAKKLKFIRANSGEITR